MNLHGFCSGSGWPLNDVQKKTIVPLCRVTYTLRICWHFHFGRGRGAINGGAIHIHPITDGIDQRYVLWWKITVAHRANIEDKIASFAGAVDQVAYDCRGRTIVGGSLDTATDII